MADIAALDQDSGPSPPDEQAELEYLVGLGEIANASQVRPSSVLQQDFGYRQQCPRAQ